MKCIGGVWLPDHETHMVDWMRNRNEVVDGKLTYQYAKLQASLKYCKQFRTALDIGAHVGTWSMHLAKKFERVNAFEPLAEHASCFVRNVDMKNVTLFDCALGDKTGSVEMEVPQGSCGGTHVKGDGDIPLMPLDSFKFENVDFIKIDVEGFEYFVVKGGKRMIRENKPVIIVEQKPKGLAERYGLERMQAVKLLQSCGAKIRFEMSGDYCLSFN